MWLQVWTRVCDITLEENGLTAFSSCREALSPCPKGCLVSACCQLALAEQHTSRWKRVGSWSLGWFCIWAEGSWTTVRTEIFILFFFFLETISSFRCINAQPKWQEGLRILGSDNCVYWFCCISLFCIAVIVLCRHRHQCFITCHDKYNLTYEGCSELLP